MLRIEDRLRAELQDGNGDKNVEAQLLLERRHLEKHKAAVMAEALETSRRHQEHVNALRKMGGG